MHGQANPLRDTQKSGRNMDVEYDTPFDDQGHCHHHPRVQMATKPGFEGGGRSLCLHAPNALRPSMTKIAAWQAVKVVAAEAAVVQKEGMLMMVVSLADQANGA